MVRSAIAWLRNDLRLRDNETPGLGMVRTCYDILACWIILGRAMTTVYDLHVEDHPPADEK